jgi:hypothetical protein
MKNANKLNYKTFGVHNIFVSQALQPLRNPLQPLWLNHTKFAKMLGTQHLPQQL